MRTSSRLPTAWWTRRQGRWPCHRRWADWVLQIVHSICVLSLRAVPILFLLCADDHDPRLRLRRRRQRGPPQQRRWWWWWWRAAAAPVGETVDCDGLANIDPMTGFLSVGFPPKTWGFFQKDFRRSLPSLSVCLPLSLSLFPVYFFPLFLKGFFVDFFVSVGCNLFLFLIFMLRPGNQIRLRFSFRILGDLKIWTHFVSFFFFFFLGKFLFGCSFQVFIKTL